ncbi:low-density lipoprotein receptor-related protein 3 [Protopterus annectens]|uniref:low-density lipoprotein receptor-related protein 3 n=1 Tax=Protopterus annectens TaxID=7888 RepID=UPI001CF9EE96|nr:low-density lipoprotein receptor-related protein 3 [Protopterus annectens]
MKFYPQPVNIFSTAEDEKNKQFYYTILEAESACNGKLEQHTERRGVIYSPSWPINYPSGVNCSWYIQGDHGDIITISFKNFDIEESHKCTLDWLMIGPSPKREEYKVCGSSIPPSFISARDHVWIFFHSDAASAGQAQGFRLSYIRGKLGQSSCQPAEFLCGNGKCILMAWKCNKLDECGDSSDEKNCTVPPTEPVTSICPSGTFQCNVAHSTHCLTNELRCNSVKDCSDGSDEDNCPELSCGKRLGNFYGSFASPDFFRPDHSGAGLHCTWFVDTQDNRHVILQMDLQLGYNDYIHIYDGIGERSDKLLQTISYHNNRHSVNLESSKGQLTVSYHVKSKSTGHGFNATYQVKGYCLPWEHPCGSDEGCYTDKQHCDGWWHCPNGKDEENCPACQKDEHPCEGNSGLCYSVLDRCNNQKNCPDGSDEKNCFTCQPGNFHCGTNLCIFETWRCDGQEDCQDGSDEQDCLVIVPRKVITAALIGSLICGLLLVIALGCAFKLYSLRTREYRAFETQMTRLEAEFVRREAPPSYGQLIAQGLIPPVEDFPVYNASQVSVLQNIRTAMRRQMRRHSSRRTSRQFGRIWSRLFHRPRVRGQIPLLTPPNESHPSLVVRVQPSEIIDTVPGSSAICERHRSETDIGTHCNVEEHQEFSNNSLQSEFAGAEIHSSSVLLSTSCTDIQMEPDILQISPISATEQSSCNEMCAISEPISQDPFRDPLLECVPDTLLPSVTRNCTSMTSISGTTYIKNRHKAEKAQHRSLLNHKDMVSFCSEQSSDSLRNTDHERYNCTCSFEEEALSVQATCLRCHSLEVPIQEPSTLL